MESSTPREQSGLETARGALLARRRDVFARYRSTLVRADEELESREIEAIENATELWDARLMTMLSAVDANLLAEIVAALRRIDEGSYGTCVDCALPIDPDRLAALPEASRCIICASAVGPRH